MTSNQISMLRHLEDARHNQEMELETKRSNIARESENFRSNVAKESELHRSNLITERLQKLSIDESVRHNTMMEHIGIANAYETQRSNAAREAETNRHNKSQEGIEERHNYAQEYNQYLLNQAKIPLLNAQTTHSRMQAIGSLIGSTLGIIGFLK